MAVSRDVRRATYLFVTTAGAFAHRLSLGSPVQSGGQWKATIFQYERGTNLSVRKVLSAPEHDVHL